MQDASPSRTALSAAMYRAAHQTLDGGRVFHDDFALPIIGGQVRDVNHIWSDQTLLGYEEWKRNFMMLRERLLAGTY